MRLLLAVLTASACWGAQSLQLGSGLSVSASWANAGSFTRASEVNQTMTWEFRVHNYSAPGSNQYVFAYGGDAIYCQLYADGTLLCKNDYDSWLPAHDGILSVSLAGRTDFIARVVRDAANMLWYLEVKNTAGGGYVQTLQSAIAGLGTGSASSSGTGRLASVAIANPNTSARLAWLRWRYATPTAGSATMPQGVDSLSTTVAAYEFEGTLADSSGNANSAALTGSGASYVTSPTYTPACDAGTTKSVRATSTLTLDATGAAPLNDNASLSYLWQVSSKPAGAPDPVWSSHSVKYPAVTGLVFGSYVFSLQVTDSSGQTQSGSPCTVKHGVVVTDSNGNVVIPNAQHAEYFNMLGGTPAFITDQAPQAGVNQYPWYGQISKAVADTIAYRFGTQYPAPWNVSLAGTISLLTTCTDQAQQISSTCSVVTGTGTNFKADFCGGGSTAVDNATIVVWYDSTQLGAGRGRRNYPIKSCDSATQITLGNGSAWSWITRSDAWVAATATGLHYGIMTDTNSGPWMDNRAPAGYYEAPAALLFVYYATGLDDYLTAFRNLTDDWFSCPYAMDKGAAAVEDLGTWGFTEPRKVGSFASFILRANDGQSWMWPGIRRIAQYWEGHALAAGQPGDLRNAGFEMGWLSMMSMWDPDSTQTGTDCTGGKYCWWQKVVDAQNNTWAPYRITRSGGTYNYWHAADAGLGGGFNFGGGGSQIFTGTATVTVGSTAVSGTGTNFLTTWNGGLNGCNGYIWFSDTANTSPLTATGDINGDEAAYRVSAVNSNLSITLLRPYAGAGTAGQVISKNYGCVGYGADSDNTMIHGNQPFMHVLGAGHGFWWARRAASSAYHNDPTLYSTWGTYITGIGNWYKDYAYQTSNGGTTFWGTSPTTQTTSAADHCYTCDSVNGPGDDEGMRLNSMEGLSGLYLLYAMNPSQGLKDFIDGAIGILYGKPGSNGAVSDLRYLYGFDHNYTTTDYASNPIPSKWDGYKDGLGRNWAWFSQRIGGLAPAATLTPQVSVRFADHPAAVSARLTVTDPQGNATQYACASSPCSISYDSRQGGYTLKKELLNGSGVVVMSTEAEPIR